VCGGRRVEYAWDYREAPSRKTGERWARKQSLGGGVGGRDPRKKQKREIRAEGKGGRERSEGRRNVNSMSPIKWACVSWCGP